jgi:hypothetical protein
MDEREYSDTSDEDESSKTDKTYEDDGFLEGADENLLAHLAHAQLSTSESSGTKPAGEASKKRSSGLRLKVKLDEIIGDQMQIDSGSCQSLKELVQQFVIKKFEEAQTDVTFAKFKEEYPEVVEDLLTQVETKIILKQYVIDERTLSKAIECSIACLKRIIHKEEQFQQSEVLPNFSARTCRKARALIFQNLPSRCIAACRASGVAPGQLSYYVQ